MDTNPVVNRIGGGWVGGGWPQVAEAATLTVQSGEEPQGAKKPPCRFMGWQAGRRATAKAQQPFRAVSGDGEIYRAAAAADTYEDEELGGNKSVLTPTKLTPCIPRNASRFPSKLPLFSSQILYEQSIVTN